MNHAVATDVSQFLDDCTRAGLDLHASTSVSRYNARVEAPFHLPGDGAATVLVVGNTRALWPHLERFVVSTHPRPSDPVDEYVVQVVGRASRSFTDLVDIRYSHEAPPRRIAIQRLAHVAGLAWLSPSHLCVHPTYGPWIALRAAVVLARPSTSPGADASAPCDCARHCAPALAHAVAEGEPTNNDEMVREWERWLAVRDACPIGREHRYADEQIRYHYLGERPPTWA